MSDVIHAANFDIKEIEVILPCEAPFSLVCSLAPLIMVVVRGVAATSPPYGPLLATAVLAVPTTAVIKTCTAV